MTVKSSLPCACLAATVMLSKCLIDSYFLSRNVSKFCLALPHLDRVRAASFSQPYEICSKINPIYLKAYYSARFMFNVFAYFYALAFADKPTFEFLIW